MEVRLPDDPEVAESKMISERGSDGRRALQGPVELEQPLAHVDRDPVEHDRRDHLVGADGGAEEAGDAAPERSAEDPGQDAEADVQRPAQPLEVRPDEQGEDEPDPVLALAADVEEAAPEREGDGERGEDQRGRGPEGLLQVARRRPRVLTGQPLVGEVEAGSLEDRPVRRDRVVACDAGRRGRRSGRRGPSPRAGRGSLRRARRDSTRRE